MKRRLTAIILSLCMVISLFPVTAFADVSTDPFVYIDDDHEHETSEEGSYTSPAAITLNLRGGTVVDSGTCGENATWELDSTGLLTISGSGAMTDYTTSNNRLAPWDGYRTQVLSVAIDDGITHIGNYSFYNCSNLVTVDIPDSVNSIGTNVFYECSSLHTVEISDGITEIKSSTFYGCSDLAGIRIPDGVTSIGNYAFYGCRSLVQVEIPNSVTSLGDDSFRRCDSLERVKLSNSLSLISSYAFYDCTSLQSIVIPEGVRNIGSNAFYKCTNLAKVYFPNSLTWIGQAAFYNCTKLNDMYYSGTSSEWGNVTIVQQNDRLTGGIRKHFRSQSGTCGDNAYWILYDDGTLRIYGSGAMYDYSTGSSYPYASTAPWTDLSYSSIQIEEGITKVGANAFKYSHASSLELPSTLATIGGTAFYSSDIEGLTFPAGGNIVINEQAFMYCTSLETIDFSNCTVTMRYSSGSGYTEVFSNCTSLKTLVIPSSVTLNGGDFCHCEALETAEVHCSSIPRYSFECCISLSSIDLAGVVTVADSVFDGTTSLVDIVFPASVNSIGINSSGYDGYVFFTQGDHPCGINNLTFKNPRAIISSQLILNNTSVPNIYGYNCSTAHRFAVSKNYNFIPLEGDTSVHVEGTAVIENQVSATCLEDGSFDEVVYCSVCGMELSRTHMAEPATGHAYEVSYDWNDENSSVTATAACSHDNSHVVTETVDTTSEVTKEPTATEYGETTYIAVFSDPVFTTQTKTVANIEPTGMSVEAQYVVVYEDGEMVFQATDDCIEGKIIKSVYGIDERSGDYPAWTAEKAFVTKAIFLNCVKPLDTSCWFLSFTQLHSIEGLNKLDTSSAVSMRSMFYNCPLLEGLDVSGFNTSNTIDMSFMFRGCKSLTTLDVSSFDTRNVTDMSSMFTDCESLTVLNLSGIDTGNVTNMNHMFYGCKSLTNLNVGSFNTSKVTNMNFMFSCCESLTTLDLSTFNTSSVTGMEHMFSSCKALTTVDVSSFDTSNVTSMWSMFNGCNALTGLDVSSFRTSNVTIMLAMFKGCSTLTTLDLSIFDTASVVTMESMFESCAALTTLNISSFDTSNVTVMTSMFAYCMSLQTLDVSHFNTGKVSSMGGMFNGCFDLEALDVSHFATSKVTDMNYMFSGCSKLTTLDVRNLDTSNVTNMLGMFSVCSSLTTLDLSGFDTSKVTNTGSMFYGCRSMTTIFAEDTFSAGRNSAEMFYNCTNLIGGNGTVYSSDHMDGEYARIDTDDAPGYFTRKAVLYDLWVGGAQVTSENLTGNGWTFDPDSNTLTLTDYSYTGEGHSDGARMAALYYGGEEELTIIFNGNNSITHISGANRELESCGIYCTNVQFKGAGVITARGGDASLGSYGIYSKNIVVSGPDINAIGGDNVMPDGYVTSAGLWVSANMNCNSCVVNANGGTVNSGQSYGLVCWHRFYSSNSTITATGGNANSGFSYGVLFAFIAQLYGNKLTALGGEGASSFGINDAGQSTIIYGGEVFAAGGTANAGISCGITLTCAGGQSYTIKDGSVKFIGGSATSGSYGFRFHPEMSNTVRFDGGTVEISANSNTGPVQALTRIPTLGEGIVAIASVNSDGSDAELFDETKIDSYKWFKAPAVMYNVTITAGEGMSPSEEYNESVLDGCVMISQVYTANDGYYFPDDYSVSAVNGVTVTRDSSRQITVSGTPTGDVEIALPDAVDSSSLPRYAIVYEDGEMVFQAGNEADPNRAVAAIYEVVDHTGSPYPAWHEKSSMVTSVTFLDSVAPVSTRGWFRDFRNLETITGIEKLNTKNVTNMEAMFRECRSLRTLDLSHFDTSRVISMGSMFYYCQALTTLDFGSFNTTNVIDMGGMFLYCKGLTTLDLSSFNTPALTSTSMMFACCTSLKSLDISSFDTTNVTSMLNMFQECSVLETVDVSGFNTGNVTNMSGMFSGCYVLDGIDVSGFNTEKVTNMSSMFSGCRLLTAIDVSGFDTKQVTTFRGMFAECRALIHLDVSGFDTQNALRMDAMFKDCYNVETLDMAHFNTVNVTDMSSMFYFCQAGAIDISSFDTSNVTNMSYMFAGTVLPSLDLSSFDTAQVTDMSWMFAYCRSLTELDVLNFDTQNVTDMSAMFYDCRALADLDLSGFETDCLVNMGGMFNGCLSLETLNLSSFNTQTVTDMGAMFLNCAALVTLDLSSFDTRNVTSFNQMFNYCTVLRTIYALDDFVVKDTADTDYMFGCPCIVGGNGTEFDANHIDGSYARIDTAENPGYFTRGAHVHILDPVEMVNATCESAGTEAYWVCRGCDAIFSDANGENEIAAPEVIPALGHDYGEWSVVTAPTCTEPGEETRSCSRCDATETRVAEALGHDLVHHDAQAATCTETGWTAYDTCSRCDYSTYQAIQALGHLPGEPVRENEIAATFTTPGSYTEVISCTRCGEELSRESVEVPVLTSVSGVCGPNVTWTLDENHVLRLSGTGEMYNYATTIISGGTVTSSSPFYEYAYWINTAIVEEGVTTIGNSAFGGLGGLTSVTLPDTITSISNNAFAETAITELDIPDSVTSIGSMVFNRCWTLTSIEIPEGVTRIEYGLFKNCARLSNLTLPKSLVYIGSDPFYECFDLRSVNYRGSYSDWRTISWYDPSYQPRVGFIHFAEGNIAVAPGTYNWTLAVDGTLTVTSFDYTDYYLYQNRITAVVVEDSLTDIPASAFNGYNGIGSVTIPGSVETIGQNAFNECTGIDVVYYGGSCADWQAVQVADGNDCLLSAVLRPTPGHDLVLVAATDATCTEVGNTAYYKCSICDEYYADADGNTRIEADSWIIPALNHNLVHHEAQAATCTEHGWEAYDTCSRCDYTTYVELPVLGHIEVIDEAVNPTCTATGLTEGKHCSRCNEILVAQTVVAALGHNFGEWTVTTDPTCTQKGVETRYCSRCDATETRDVDALGHDLVHHDAKEATCTEHGWEAYDTCSRCDYTTYAEIDALGHDYEAVVTPPTCLEGGYTTHTCSRCGDTYTDTLTAALGHNFGEWTVTTAPTCTEKGVETRYCSRCDATETRDVNALGHDLKHHEAKDATCTEPGWDAYDTCSRCDYTTYVELPSLGHVEVIDAAVDPTCTETGLTEGKHCSRCSEILVAQSVVDALGHDFGEWTVTTAPTCTQKGEETRTCSRCVEMEAREVDALGHDLIHHDAQAATCTEVGWEAYDTCSRCDYTTYVELSVLGHIEVVDEAVAPTCTETGLTEGKHCSRCNEVLVAQEIVAALGHDLIHHDAKAPTCAEIGWDAYETCSRCDYTTYVEIASLGHDLIHHDAKAPTCTEIGWDAYDTCSRCDYTTYVEIPSLGHDLIHHDAKNATCTDIGWETYDTCSRCDYTTYVELPALGHIEVVDAAVAPSCTETGLAEGKHCSRCNEVLVAQTVVAALGHDFGEWTVTTAPTCTEKGVETRYCSRCDATETKDINALGHDLIHHDAQAATCTEIGWTAYDTCSRCDYTTYHELAALGHALVHHDAQAPTCTEIGWEAYDTCSRCDYATYHELTALGHALVHHDAKAPTCTDVGWDVYDACSRCDYTTYVEIAATGHDYTDISYDWAYDGSRVTAKAVCSHDPYHIVTETVEPAGVVTLNPTETTWGETTYTAVFTNELFETQTRTVADIAPIGAVEYAQYAVVYTDGEMVFQTTDEPIEGKTIKATYSGIDDTGSTPPWDGERNIVTKVTIAVPIAPATTRQWFSNFWKVESIDGLTKLDTSNVTDMSGMFEECRELTMLDLSSFDTSNVTDMSNLFASCHSLTTIYASDAFVVRDDCEDYQLFIECISLVGGNGTRFDASFNEGKEYARIDTESAPGYFTSKQHVHVLYRIDAVAATCEANGNNAYWTCTKCGKYFGDEEGTNEIEKDSWIIPATGHAWSDIAYVWAEDNSSVTASVTCANDHSHDHSETVTANRTVITEPVCESAGIDRYTADFTNAMFEQQTKDVEVPALGHDLEHHEAKAATCTEVGWDAYDACTRCDYTTYHELDPIGHDWEITYAWGDDYSQATATGVCRNDSLHVITETVYAELTFMASPDCETAGTAIYAAEFSRPEFESQTAETELPPTGHNWVITYAWADDNSQVTATATCSNDQNHVVTETVNTTGQITLQPTETSRGETTYTATFADELFGVQTKTVDDIDPVQHVKIGDANGDGKVTAKDRILFARYLAGWEGAAEQIKDLDAMDINRDGKVNAKDRIILSRFLAGWGGEFSAYFR